MEKVKKENKIYVLVGLIFVLSLSLFLFAIYFKSSMILDKEEINAKLVVMDVLGFAVSNESLDFGGLKADTSSYKKIILTNDYEFPIRAEFEYKGDISVFLVDLFPVYLDVGEKKNVTVRTITIPEGTAYGNYTGKVVIVFKRDEKS